MASVSPKPTFKDIQGGMASAVIEESMQKAGVKRAWEEEPESGRQSESPKGPRRQSILPGWKCKGAAASPGPDKGAGQKPGMLYNMLLCVQS
jgi:hypothetical protein